MRAQPQANPENSTLLLERTEKVLFTTQLPLLSSDRSSRARERRRRNPSPLPPKVQHEEEEEEEAIAHAMRAR